MTKLSEINEKHHYDDLIDELRSLSFLQLDPVGSEPSGFYTLDNIVKRLCGQQTALVETLAKSPCVREWDTYGHPRSYSLHDPLTVAERFIQEYIRYADLCGVYYITKAKPSRGVYFEDDISFLHTLRWFRQIDSFTKDKHISIDDWMGDYTFLPTFRYEHYKFPIAGPILDIFLWSKPALSYYSETQNSKLETMYEAINDDDWLNKFFTSGNLLINNWYERESLKHHKPGEAEGEATF